MSDIPIVEDPVPSNKLEVLDANTKILDEWTNSSEDYTKDRFGNEFKTRTKILADLQKAIDDISSGASFLPKAGGTITGDLEIEGKLNAKLDVNFDSNLEVKKSMSIGESLSINGSLEVAGMPVITYIGEFRYFLFRKNKLPKGWYIMDGTLYDLTSEVGKVLNSLDEDFKSDLKIIVKDSKINIPNIFDENNNGYFARPVEGTIRQVGSIENEGLPNITGTFQDYRNIVSSSVTGAFNLNNTVGTNNGEGKGYTESALGFDASGSNNIYGASNHVTPVNFGITPAIYLGV